MSRRDARAGRSGSIRAAARAFAALSAALSMVGPPAAAQTRSGGTDEDFRSQARVRAGGLYLTPSVRLDRLGVETNVFNSTEPQADFVAAVSPSLETWLPFRRRAVLATTFVGGMEYYRTFAGERSFNPNVVSRLDVPLRRVTVFVGGDHLRTRQRPYYEIDVRASRVVSTMNGGVELDLAPRLAVGLEAARTHHRFDADAVFDGTGLAETLNREVASGSVTARWQRTALSTFVFSTEIRNVRFARSPDRNSDNLVVTVGGEFHPRALISGSGAIGVRRFAGRGPAVTDATAVVAQADLSYRLPANTTVTFEAERDILYSFRRDDAFYVINRYGVAVTHRLGASFDVTGRLVADAYDYQGATGRIEGTRSVEGTLGYYLNRGTRVGFRVRRITRDSASARWRYEGLEAGVVFDYGL